MQALTESVLLSQFSTNKTKGLSQAQVLAQREKHGFNELPAEEVESLWEKIKEQFEDILVRILLLAAIVSFLTSYFGHEEENALPPWIEPAVILTILILNAIVGIYQDANAEKALQALKQLQSTHSTVLRDSQWKLIESRELVPGDIVRTQLGDKVPADLRLLSLESTSLQADQSLLTGECEPQHKQPGQVRKEADVTEKSNMLFSGSLVVRGSGLSVVCGIGMETEMGKIQQQI